MKSYLVGALVASIASLSNQALAAQFNSDDKGILILDDSNFLAQVNQKNFLLAMFYAPWCSHCTTLEPEVKAAAIELESVGQYIGVINGDQHQKQTKNYGVTAFPTFFWFEHGVKYAYTADRDRRSIVNWAKQRSGLIASSPTHSKELECDEIEERTRKHKYTAITFASKVSAFFNWYQDLQQQFKDNRVKTGEDEDQLLGEEKDGVMVTSPLKLPKFNYYHADAKCITHYFKDKVVDPSRGAMVLITPGNKVEVLEDDDKALGLSPPMMAGFMHRYTEPNFRKLEWNRFKDVVNPDHTRVKEKKQLCILISRDAKSEYPFKPMRDAAKEMKFKMTYYYYENKKPTKRMKDIAKDIKERIEARDAANKKAVDEIKAKKEIHKGKVMNDETKEFNEKIDAEAKELEGKLKAKEFEYTKEEKEVLEITRAEQGIDWFKKSFALKEHDLPAMFFFDSLSSDILDTVYYPVQTVFRNVNKENLIEESHKFIGHWYRMVAKTENPPIDYGMALKTVVGNNYPLLVADPDSEWIMNHTIKDEPFCKMLAPQLIKLAEVLKDVKGLNFGTMDMDNNGVSYVNHKSYPTIVHFTKDNKRGRKIKFQNRKGKQIASLVEYISNHSDAYKAHVAANPSFDPIELSKTITFKSEAELKVIYEEKQKVQAAEDKKMAEKYQAEQKVKKEEEEKAKKEEEKVVDLDAAEKKPKEPKAAEPKVDEPTEEVEEKIEL